MQTFSEYFKGLRILHLALATGVSLFGLVVYFVLEPEPSGDSALFVNLSAGLLATTTAMAYWLYPQRLKAIKTNATLSEKLQSYRSACIIKYALIEGSCLVALTFYLITGNVVLLGIAAIGLAILLLNGPQELKLKTELELSSSELAQLDDPNAKVVDMNPH
jgi:hypothetical protein